MANAEVQVIPFQANQALVAQFMPVFSPVLARQRAQVIKDIIEDILKPGHDFGVIPGTDKPTLLKPGAEKLCTFFGLVPQYIAESVAEDRGTDGSEPLFAYRLKCQLWRCDQFAGEGLGYASSRESKYRYRWVEEDTARKLGHDPAKLVSRDGRKRVFEFDFAIEKAETTGQYGKPESHWQSFRDAIAEGRAKRVQRDTRNGKRDGWEIELGQVQYRIFNPDIEDVINTVLKMAMKRSLIAAVIVAVNVSDRFTQDLEDFIEVEYIDATPAPAARPQEPQQPQNGPSGVKVPWSTVGEMKQWFHDKAGHYRSQGLIAVYQSILDRCGITDLGKASVAQIRECYSSLIADERARDGVKSNES